MDNKNKCLICGKEYACCINCIKIEDLLEYENALDGEFSLDDYCKTHNISQEEKCKLFFGYRSIADSFECFLVYQTIRFFKKKRINVAQARSDLEKIGLNINTIGHLKENIKDYLMENIFIADHVTHVEEITIQDSVDITSELEKCKSEKQNSDSTKSGKASKQ